jgi:two-component system, sporulation sensor kinase D
MKDFFSARKFEIIDKWCENVILEFPNITTTSQLLNYGNCFYELVFDFDTPIQEHYLINHLKEVCDFFLKANVPIEVILYCCQLFRESILNNGLLVEVSNNIEIFNSIKGSIPIIHRRIDHVKRIICDHYISFNVNLLKSREETIKALHNDRLSQLGKMAATMAHEIRNPLTTIDGFLKLLKADYLTNQLTPTQFKNYIEILETEVKGLNRHLTDILNYSRNRYESQIPFEEVDCEELINTVLELNKPRLLDKDIQLLTLNVGSKALLQKSPMIQVLTNLINNSIDALSEFEKKERRIIIECTEQEVIHIKIIDNGEGVPLEIQDKLFEPFMTSKNNGTGLGLTICKQIVEHNNGSLNFVSKNGNTIFTLSFPKIGLGTNNAIIE